jgi:hypothetical protein
MVCWGEKCARGSSGPGDPHGLSALQGLSAAPMTRRRREGYAVTYFALTRAEIVYSTRRQLPPRHSNPPSLQVAIKRIKDVFRDLNDGKRILRELKLLRHLGGHENIVSCAIKLPASK